MDLYYENAEDLGTTQWHEETSNDVDQWQRWDEGLVQQFGRWLSLLAKAFAVLLLAISAAVLIRWF